MCFSMLFHLHNEQTQRVAHDEQHYGITNPSQKFPGALLRTQCVDCDVAYKAWSTVELPCKAKQNPMQKRYTKQNHTRSPGAYQCGVGLAGRIKAKGHRDVRWAPEREPAAYAQRHQIEGLYTPTWLLLVRSGQKRREQDVMDVKHATSTWDLRQSFWELQWPSSCSRWPSADSMRWEVRNVFDQLWWLLRPWNTPPKLPHWCWNP